jgi:hypothetical protein
MPVSAMTPMTIPAHAHAIATDSAFFAPSMSASRTVHHVTPSARRAHQRDGKHAIVPASAESGAE